MAHTTILASATGAGNSSDIVVGATPISVAIFAADGVISSSVQCPVYRKVGANYQPHCDADGRRVFLSADRPDYTFTGPGTYRVSKLATAESIGVAQDTTA